MRQGLWQSDCLVVDPHPGAADLDRDQLAGRIGGNFEHLLLDPRPKDKCRVDVILHGNGGGLGIGIGIGVAVGLLCHSRLCRQQ